LKKLDQILIHSVSLVNRLIVVPNDAVGSSESQQDHKPIDQSLLYVTLIKSINQISNHRHSLNIEHDASDQDPIKSNNQFLQQLQSMMRSAEAANSLTDAAAAPNEINWFQLLTKITLYKSNQILDCLLFSIFKKIAQLAPPLFTSLIGPY
jgi:hypothetical protein